MTTRIARLRRDMGAAIELLEACEAPAASIEWFRKQDSVLAKPDDHGSHLATAKLLAASANGMGRPLEVVIPKSGSDLSQADADRRRDEIIASMWAIAGQLAGE